EQRALRRLFQNLEQCVSRVGIKLINGVDDTDPPAVDRRSRAEERNGLARFVDRDHGPHHALVIERALEREQTAMRARRDLTRNRIGWLDLKRLGRTSLLA